MQNLKEFLEKRISHANTMVNLIQERQGCDPHKNYNYFGGQDLGYWQGKLSAYEIVFDRLEEMEKEINNE